MTLDDVFDDCETEPRAAGFATPCGIDAIKALRDPRKMLARDPRPVIRHRQYDPASVLQRGNVDYTARPVAAVAHGIAHQIVEDLDQLRAVSAHRWQVARDVHGKFATAAAADLADVGDRGLDDVGNRDRFIRREEAVGLNTRQAHQILDDAQHAPRFVADGAAEVGAEL